jgi:cell division protein FtsL
MNAAARDLQQGSLFQGSLRKVTFSWDTFLVSVLIVVMLFSAVAVVYVKNQERHLFSELQQARHASEKLAIEWGQLLLEQSTWVTPSRIQSVAQQRFAMHVPQTHHWVTVKL